jgi:hypothetical protein
MRNRGKIFFVTLFMGFYVLLTPALSGGEQAEPDVKNLRAMTRDSGVAYPKENLAVASGVGWIKEDTAQGRLLARRAALLDARRNLLALRRKLLDKSRYSKGVSGHVAAHQIRGERIDGDLYFVEVETFLDELLKPNFSAKFFMLLE